MKEKEILILLFLVMIISGIIISIFTLLCPFDATLKIALTISFVFSLVSFGVYYLILKKVLNKILNQQKDNQNLQSKMNQIEFIDKLTNIPNRNKFIKDLRNAKSMMLVNLDDFSLINDVYSRETGDEFLAKLAHTLSNLDFINNNLYRLSGDEFAVLFFEESEIKSYAQKLLKAIENFYLIVDNVMVQVSATIAISYKKPLLETTDLALKYGKKNKINIVIYNDKLEVFEKSQIFLDVTLRLKKALKEDNVIPFFQCVVDKEGKVIKYEALMRIKEGDKYILPNVFLDIAKTTKLYTELSIKMINKTFAYMKDKNIPFSINLSYDDIINERVYNLLIENIDKFDKKENIIIELLETEAIKFDKVQKFIELLHSKNVKIAIDDFGSGYSNFIYLEKLKPDMIKIDGSIVQTILSSDNAEFIVRTIVDFCKKNNIISIAEFVSHKEIFEALNEIGVDEFQGFYFCKPKGEI